LGLLNILLNCVNNARGNLTDGKGVGAMESNRTERFWLDGFEGKAAGGFFIRNDLVKTIERLESQGKKVVGVTFDGTWNLELIVQVPTDEEKN